MLIEMNVEEGVPRDELSYARAMEIGRQAGVRRLSYDVMRREWTLTRIGITGAVERYTVTAGRLEEKLRDLVVVATKELLS